MHNIGASRRIAAIRGLKLPVCTAFLTAKYAKKSLRRNACRSLKVLWVVTRRFIHGTTLPSKSDPSLTPRHLVPQDIRVDTDIIYGFANHDEVVIESAIVLALF